MCLSRFNVKGRIADQDSLAGMQRDTKRLHSMCQSDRYEIGAVHRLLTESTGREVIHQSCPVQLSACDPRQVAGKQPEH